jgi:hypothetical protein
VFGLAGRFYQESGISDERRRRVSGASLDLGVPAMVAKTERAVLTQM